MCALIMLDLPPTGVNVLITYNLITLIKAMSQTVRILAVKSTLLFLFIVIGFMQSPIAAHKSLSLFLNELADEKSAVLENS